MNVRGTSMCLLCAGALFVACGSKSGKTAEVAGQADTVHVVGGDKDKHGCLASAGYTWSEAQKDCIRLWEKGVRMNAVDDAEKVLFPGVQSRFYPSGTVLFGRGNAERDSGAPWPSFGGICLECGR